MLIKESGERDGRWTYYENFIDKNDNFVGFDMFGQCCESYGWFISRDRISDEGYEERQGVADGIDITDFYFDTDEEPVYEGDSLSFKIKKDNGEVAYLNIYNYHNGYYAHGWEYSLAGNLVDGNL